MDRRWKGSIAGWAVAGLLAMGCTEPNPAYSPGAELPEECRAGQEQIEAFEVFERPDKVDLWFVISDSEAMSDVVDYQRALAEAVEPFLLHAADEGFHLRVAVSTMDATEEPGLAAPVDDVAGCEGNDRQVADSVEDDDWVDVVRCNLQQGGLGERRARALDVIHSSLIDEPDSLTGFRRDDARLAVVMLSNQDDCSAPDFDDDADEPIRDLCAWQSEAMRDVGDWAEAIQQVAVVPEGISLAVMAGPPTEVVYEQGESVLAVCSSTLGSSYPSPRLYDAAKRFGDQGLFASSCVFGFSNHLDEIADRLVLQDSVSLCATREMAHEPLEVVGVYGEEREPIPFGPGFVFPGPTEKCSLGGIELRRQAAASLQRVEMTYCAR